jgi:hypothetical protein
MRLVPIVVVLALGCGDPASPPAVSGGGDGPINVGIDRGGTGGSGAGGVGGAGGYGGEAAGACDNSADLDALAGAGRVRDVARDCGVFRCSGSVEDSDVYEACVRACVENDVQAISTECASCYSEAERCSLDAFCQPRCQANTCSSMCLSCLSSAGCVSAFEACTGLAGIECG